MQLTDVHEVRALIVKGPFHFSSGKYLSFKKGAVVIYSWGASANAKCVHTPNLPRPLDNSSLKCCHPSIGCTEIYAPPPYSHRRPSINNDRSLKLSLMINYDHTKNVDEPSFMLTQQMTSWSVPIGNAPPPQPHHYEYLCTPLNLRSRPTPSFLFTTFWREKLTR